MSPPSAKQPKKTKKRKSYSDREIDIGLTALAVCGAPRRAAGLLQAEMGWIVPQDTIRDWAKRYYPERYERICQEVGPKIKAQMAEMHLSLAIGAGEIEAKAVERIRERLDANQGDLRDLSAVQQRAAVSTGIHSDKHLLYSGQPTQIVQRSATEVIRALKAKGVSIPEAIEHQGEIEESIVEAVEEGGVA